MKLGILMDKLRWFLIFWGLLGAMICFVWWYLRGCWLEHLLKGPKEKQWVRRVCICWNSYAKACLMLAIGLWIGAWCTSLTWVWVLLPLAGLLWTGEAHFEEYWLYTPEEMEHQNRSQRMLLLWTVALLLVVMLASRTLWGNDWVRPWL